MILIGTNADKVSKKLNREPFKKFAEQYNMIYHEISCLNPKQVHKIVDDAVFQVIQDIDQGKYKWNEKKLPGEEWIQYGISVVGNRSIIDNPLKND